MAAVPGFLILADDLLGRIEGHEETVWFWLSSGRWKPIIVSGVLRAVCRPLFWSGVVRPGHRGTRAEWQPAPGRNSINVEDRAGHDACDEFLGQTGFSQKNQGRSVCETQSGDRL